MTAKPLKTQVLPLLRASLQHIVKPMYAKEIFRLSRNWFDREVHLPMLEKIERNDSDRIIVGKRFNPPLAITALEKYPDGSIGAAYLEFLREHGKDIPQVRTAFHDDLDYIFHRIEVTHNLWHIITGFDTSPSGEAGLHSFYLSQLNLVPSAMAIALTGLHITLMRPKELSHFMNEVARGWRMGQMAYSLFGLPLEQRLGDNLEEVREELCLLGLKVSKPLPRLARLQG